MLLKNHMDACVRTWFKPRRPSELFARVEGKSDDLDPEETLLYSKVTIPQMTNSDPDHSSLDGKFHLPKSYTIRFVCQRKVISLYTCQKYGKEK
jgi:hypothetical protein